MNDYIGVTAVVVSVIFAALPQDLVATVTGCGAIFGGLYLVSGRLPDEP